MQTTMYLNGMPGLDVPPLALQPQSAPVQGQESFTWPVGTLASYPMPASIPGIAPQDLMASAQSTLDAHRIFMVSSVRNDEIASRGPNPFASDCSRPWGGGNPGMGPYMVPPTMQQPITRPLPGPPFKPHIASQASGHPQGEGALLSGRTDRPCPVESSIKAFAMQAYAEIPQRHPMQGDLSRAPALAHNSLKCKSTECAVLLIIVC